jgi:NADH-quinone oxidoreductase subunit J
MNGVAFAQIGLEVLWQSPITWGLALSALGMWVCLVRPEKRLIQLGHLISATGLVVLAIGLPKLSQLEEFGQWVSQITFWILAATSIVCAAAAVTVHNPVYTAIWFAGSLLGVAGLFLFQNAQFLGFATIVVYAGAIVVTFLFVLMLANPEGHAMYDRISWAKFPVPVMILAAAAFVVIVAMSFLSQPLKPAGGGESVQGVEHVARLGSELFAKHLVSVEVAGTILLVALVGAIVILIQGKEQARTAAVSDVRSGRETL